MTNKAVIKKHYLFLVITVLFLLSVNTYADDSVRRSKDNFSGRIEIGPLFISTSNQSYAGSDNKRTESLTGEADDYELFIPLILFDFRYRFEYSGNEVYAGTPVKDAKPALAVGAVFPFAERSRIDISAYSTPFIDVWQDPYVTGVDREKTDQNVGGMIVDYENIMGSDLSLSYALEFIDVDRDLIGDADEDLRRDGKVHEAQVSYRFDIRDSHFITPKLEYALADMDGESESYYGYAVKLNYLFLRPKLDYAFNIFVSGKRNFYEKTHYIFNKTRKENKYRLLAIFTILKPFGYEDYYSNIVAGYFTTDSNINFFDSNTLIAAITLGYKF